MDDAAWEAVTDTLTAERLALRGKELVYATDKLQFLLKRVPGRVAAVAESGSRLTATNIERLVEAFGDQEEAFAVGLEKLRYVAPVFRMRPSEAGFEGFNHACSHYNYSICAGDFSAVVVCSTGDFFVYAGSPRFVRSALGQDLSDSFSTLDNYIRRFPTEDSRLMLNSVLVAIRDEFPVAADGSWVTFPK